MKKIVLLALLFATIVSQTKAQEYNPVADPAAIVTSGNARFTVLTPRVIRMEWSADKKFNDNASLTFVNRKLPVPKFTSKETGGELIITTESIELIFKTGLGSFNENNLKVKFKDQGEPILWKPGMANNGNLLGTTRTLDQCDGPPRQGLEQGLISRDGWMMIDDSQRPLFDNSEWPWVMARPDKEQQDFYLFMYGNDYKKALKDYTEVAGKIAMPPRFAFGAWWSRYREYSDVQFRELVDEFEAHDVPLDVLVIDIDWHIRVLPGFYKNGSLQSDQAGQPYGWTGYTWDTNYFPDPDKFLKWTDDQNLKTCLNLHPASGVQPYEKKYPEMAKAMGIDPASEKYVPFDITGKKFAKNYMDILLHPFEESGVDFWWLDWQQWGSTDIPGVNPTFYLNYVHYSDMESQNKVRPLIFHRWGGLGNHRYQIGFSGDTYNTWKSLDYQPYFTATAANVGFGYWSHDIGGHFGYPNSAEMYTRWIQWGIFSPIFRTHCTESDWLERRIWAYPLENFNIMRDAYWLRYAMVPYIYTEAYHTYQSGVSIVHPLYYEYPDDEKAYSFPNQYMFGRNMMVSPITKPIGKDSIYTMQKIWLPEGQWFEMSTGTMLSGAKTIDMPFALDDIPVFVKEGAIIPMQPKASRIDNAPVNPLILTFFPGKRGAYELYEDEGNNNNFKEGAFSFTPIKYEYRDNEMDISIDPVVGSFPGMLSERAYELRFPCTYAPERVTVNGKNYTYDNDGFEGSWKYKGDELETRVFLSAYPTDEEIEIIIEFPGLNRQLLSGKKGQFKHMQKFDDFRVRHAWDRGKYDALTIASLSTFPQSLEYAPQNLNPQAIENFNDSWNRALLTLQEISNENSDYKPYYEFLKLFGEIAESPEIVPLDHSNVFDEKTTVELKSEGDNLIFYTIDGSQPSKSSARYNFPIEIKDPTVIKAIACPSERGQCSSAASKIFYKKNTGLNYSIYKGSWDQMPDFNQLTSERTGQSYNLNLEEITDLGRDYGVVFTGFITIPKKGKYTFYLTSDDGSRLFINDKLLVDNDGLHAAKEEKGHVTLSKGVYPIKLEFFQGEGGAYISVDFESINLPRTNVLPFYLKKEK